MPYHDLFATYSIVARDPQTGQMGVAVETHQMSVGAVVPWVLPGVGAVATQSLVNVRFGPMGIDWLKMGVPAPEVIKALVTSDAMAGRRQVAAVDAQGRVGAWTGDGCIPEAGHHIGEGYSVQANMMTFKGVPEAMRKAYESTSGDLAARMVAALQAAQGEDGDIRGMQSAALVIVPPEGDDITRRVYNLRVDEHEEPVTELARLVRLRSAQLLDAEGEAAYERGEHEKALQLFAQSRERAPELEESAFWQAVLLANAGDIQNAAAILRPALAKDTRRTQWIDLLNRLQQVKLIEREGAAAELIQALG